MKRFLQTRLLQTISWNDFSKFRSELYGLSAIWIFLFHGIVLAGMTYRTENTMMFYIEKMIRRGNMGVDIFLFLSGISLYYTFQKKPGLSSYIQRRFLRVWIPVLLIDGVHWSWILLQDHDLAEFLIRISTLSFWAHGTQRIWFVSTILLCYLVYPYLYDYFFGEDTGTVRKLVQIMVITMGLTIAFSIVSPDFYKKWEIALTRLPIFIIGAFAGKWCYEKRRIPFWGVLAAFGITIVSIFLYSHSPKWFQGIWGRYSYIICIAYMIVFIYVMKVIRFSFLNSLLKWFGNLSLQLYLTSILFIDLHKKMPFYEKGDWFQYCVLSCICIAVSYVVYQIPRYTNAAYQHLCKKSSDS